MTTAFLLAEEPAMTSMTQFLVYTIIYAALAILAGCWIVALLIEHGQEKDDDQRRAELQAAAKGRR